MNMHTPLRSAVVSGGSGYVGREIARKLAAEGFAVSVLYRNASGKDMQDFATSLGEHSMAYKCDLTDTVAIEKTLGEIASSGDIEAIVHAAGSMPKPRQLHAASAEELREYFESDVIGAFNFLTAGARILKERGNGTLIGITTAGVATLKNTNARGLYSPVKFAIQGILVALREELSPKGVRVYSIAPGVMEGGMNKNTPKAFLEIVRSKGRTKELASAVKVADAIAELIRKESMRPLTTLIAPETEEA